MRGEISGYGEVKRRKSCKTEVRKVRGQGEEIENASRKVGGKRKGIGKK